MVRVSGDGERGNHPPLMEIHPPTSSVSRGVPPTSDEGNMTILIQPIVGPQTMAWHRSTIIPIVFFANLPDIQPESNGEYSGLEALPHIFDSLVEHSLLHLGVTTDEVALYIIPTERDRPNWSSKDRKAKHRRSEVICVLYTTTATPDARMRQIVATAHGNVREETFLVPVETKKAGHARRDQE